VEPPDPDDLVEEQIAYYRARAPEYDDWWLRLGRYQRGSELDRRWETEKGALRDALDAWAPRGRVLELAAGTGNYTRELARHAEHITAVDASPETLERNRSKLPVGGAPVDYVVADVFDWQPPTTYDVVFFSFWLTHVPPGRFDAFWRLVDSALAPDGRVLFIDNAMPLEVAASRFRTETGAPVVRTPWSATDIATGVAVRELNDGRRFNIVKRHWEPDELVERLATIGWRAEVHTTETAFLYGWAVRA
jgi:demethylmenaquinone methyltransferase/2-methoxy-6-polyprenyl-1,4-benzoquinol methylase